MEYHMVACSSVTQTCKTEYPLTYIYIYIYIHTNINFCGRSYIIQINNKIKEMALHHNISWTEIQLRKLFLVPFWFLQKWLQSKALPKFWITFIWLSWLWWMFLQSYISKQTNKQKKRAKTNKKPLTHKK